MKFTKVLCLLLALSICSVKASAPDEGMWIPSLIGKNYEELKKLGFKLTAEDIYNINQASLKDAIVSLGFCTGEIISNQGLMLTNHHCGYGSIQYHSSVDHDYLSDGFYAKTQADELSSPEVTASNNTIQITVDGTQSGSVTVPAAHYTSESALAIRC